MKAGSVVVATFPGVVQTKKRPAVVVSPALYHQDRPDLILAVVSSQIQKAISKTDHVLIDWQAANLARPSFVRMFLYTIPASDVFRIGELATDDWTAVQRNLASCIDL